MLSAAHVSVKLAIEKKNHFLIEPLLWQALIELGLAGWALNHAQALELEHLGSSESPQTIDAMRVRMVLNDNQPPPGSEVHSAGSGRASLARPASTERRGA
jgi:hypothetical protein